MENANNEIDVAQGWSVFLWGVLGCAFAVSPALLLLPVPGIPKLTPPWKVVLPILWACFVGAPFTKYWSRALHARIALLKKQNQESAGRVEWLPAWIGLFERAFYCLLIGLDIPGGATFVGAWVAIKSAGGWQLWSKGTTYGRAILFAGLLGNAMSILFGVVAGLVIKA